MTTTSRICVLAGAAALAALMTLTLPAATALPGARAQAASTAQAVGTAPAVSTAQAHASSGLTGTPPTADPQASATQQADDPDAAGRGRYTPSASEWWLAGWQVQQTVWPLSEGAGVTVAVVDTGVQATVPDLRGVVVPGGDMLGDSGNGETDFDTQVDGHGTAVAVLIAGQGHGTGTVGVAPQARILPVHVDTPGLAGNTEDLAAGIEFAAAHGASVINVSLGPASPSATSCDNGLQEAVADAIERGAVVIASAGDTNVSGSGPVEPAACAGVLAVGGVEPDGALWPGTVRQPYVSVAAPAAPIDYVGRDGRYSTQGTGTSASAPLVAGLAALIRSRYPTMPWYQVDQRIIATATAKGSPVPSPGYGYGIVDPARALSTPAAQVTVGPDPVQAKFQAWLASPAGQAWQQAAVAPATAAPQAAPSLSPSPSPRAAPIAAVTPPEPVAAAPASIDAYARVSGEPASVPLHSRAIVAVLGLLAALCIGNLVLFAVLRTRSRRRAYAGR